MGSQTERGAARAVFHHMPHPINTAKFLLMLTFEMLVRVQLDRYSCTSGRRVDCLSVPEKPSSNSYQEPLKCLDPWICFWKCILRTSAKCDPRAKHTDAHCSIAESRKRCEMIQQFSNKGIIM